MNVVGTRAAVKPPYQMVTEPVALRGNLPLEFMPFASDYHRRHRTREPPNRRTPRFIRISTRGSDQSGWRDVRE